MRFETTFLPPRTSTISSMGISTRPILSCRLNAATRLSRLSFTFFSKPEYVWMMYHCIPIDLWSSLSAKLLENVGDAKLHKLVDHREKHSKERHRGDYNPSGRDHVFAARPGDLLHLHAHVVQEFTRVGDGSCNLLRQLRACSALRLIAAHFHRPRGHKSSFQCALCALPNSGRGGGIRTPIPGFGDRSPSRWTTPLYPEPAKRVKGFPSATSSQARTSLSGSNP